LLGFGDVGRQVGNLHLDACGAELFEHGETGGTPGGGDDARISGDRHLDRGLAER
jgi:hypothetical protein